MIHVGYDVECLPALLVRWEPDGAALSATRDQGNVLGFHRCESKPVVGSVLGVRLAT